MKTKHLLMAVVPLLLLTACQTVRQPSPGNELVELISHKDFQLVATAHPEFASHLIKTITRLEIEQAQANYKKMEAIKARYQKMPRPVPIPLPPAPAKP